MDNFPKATLEQSAKTRSILKRRNLGLLMMLLSVPTVAVVDKLTGSDNLALATAILFMVAIFSLLLSVAFARCPRCNKMFFFKWYWGNGFALKCVHCGLS